MFNPLLKLKHWHIFVLQVAGIIVFQIIIFSVMFAQLSPQKGPVHPQEMTGAMQTFFALMILPILYSLYFTLGWQWAIINKFKEKLPAEVSIPFTRVKVFFIIQLIMILLMLGAMIIFFSFMSSPQTFAQNEPPVWFFSSFAIFFPLELFLIFCVLHNFVFTAKTLKAVELQRAVKFEDYVGEFFCIWFQIIGIWILQPRINKIYAGTSTAHESQEVVDTIPKDDQEVY